MYPQENNRLKNHKTPIGVFFPLRGKPRNLLRGRGDFLINRHVSEAPVIIAVCSKDKSYRWAPLDCAMASQNIMLEAHSLGLGSCFIGVFDENKIKELLGLPDKMGIVGLITLGYPDEKVDAPPRLELEEVVHYDAYRKDKSDASGKTILPRSGMLSFVTKFLKGK